MLNIITDLKMIIEKYLSLLVNAEEASFSVKPHPSKWSKKEELGHLIDSAQNNIQRFIRVQYEETSVFYHPDNWVAFNGYQHIPLKDLNKLWYLLNKQICIILQKMDASNYEKLIDVGNNASQKVTTLFLAEDYVVHMKHHLENIFSI